MTPLLLALIMAGGVAMCQDAIMSILWYLKNDQEKWHYHHAARLGRLAWGVMLIVIASLELAKL